MDGSQLLTLIQDADSLNELLERLVEVIGSRPALQQRLQYKIVKSSGEQKRTRGEERFDLFFEYHGTDDGTLKLLADFWDQWHQEPQAVFCQPIDGYKIDPIGNPHAELVSGYMLADSKDR